MIKVTPEGQMCIWALEMSISSLPKKWGNQIFHRVFSSPSHSVLERKLWMSIFIHNQTEMRAGKLPEETKPFWSKKFMHLNKLKSLIFIIVVEYYFKKIMHIALFKIVQECSKLDKCKDNFRHRSTSYFCSTAQISWL